MRRHEGRLGRGRMVLGAGIGEGGEGSEVAVVALVRRRLRVGIGGEVRGRRWEGVGMEGIGVGGEGLTKGESFLCSCGLVDLLARRQDLNGCGTRKVLFIHVVWKH